MSSGDCINPEFVENFQSAQTTRVHKLQKMFSKKEIDLFKRKFELMEGEINDEEFFLALAKERLRLRKKKSGEQTTDKQSTIYVTKETPMPQQVTGQVLSKNVIAYKRGVFVGKVGLAMLTTPAGRKFIIFKEQRGYNDFATLKRLGLWCFNPKQPLKFHRNLLNYYIREENEIWWRLSFRNESDCSLLLKQIDGINMKLIKKPVGLNELVELKKETVTDVDMKSDNEVEVIDVTEEVKVEPKSIQYDSDEALVTSTKPDLIDRETDQQSTNDEQEEEEQEVKEHKKKHKKHDKNKNKKKKKSKHEKKSKKEKFPIAELPLQQQAFQDNSAETVNNFIASYEGFLQFLEEDLYHANMHLRERVNELSYENRQLHHEIGFMDSIKHIRRALVENNVLIPQPVQDCMFATEQKTTYLCELFTKLSINLRNLETQRVEAIIQTEQLKNYWEKLEKAIMRRDMEIVELEQQISLAEGNQHLMLQKQYFYKRLIRIMMANLSYEIVRMLRYIEKIKHNVIFNKIDVIIKSEKLTAIVN